MKVILILLGLLGASVFVIVLLTEKMNSMREQYRLSILDEKRHTEEVRQKANTEIAAARKKAETEVAEARKKAEAEIAEARKKAEAEIAESQERADQTISAYKEYIESRRKVLMTQDEKTLMVDAVLGLSSLGERLDNLKTDLQQVTTRQIKYHNATSDTLVVHAAAIDTIKNNIGSIKSSVSSIESNTDEIDTIKNNIDSIKSSIDSVEFDTRNMRSDTDDIKSQIDDIRRTVDDIKSETNDIYYKIN